MVIENSDMIYNYVAGVGLKYPRKRITMKLINEEILEHFGNEISFEKQALKQVIKEYYQH